MGVSGRLSYHTALCFEKTPADVYHAQADCPADRAVCAVARSQVSLPAVHADFFCYGSVYPNHRAGIKSTRRNVVKIKANICDSFNRSNNYRQVFRSGPGHYSINSHLFYCGLAVSGNHWSEFLIRRPVCSWKHPFYRFFCRWGKRETVAHVIVHAVLLEFFISFVIGGSLELNGTIIINKRLWVFFFLC